MKEVKKWIETFENSARAIRESGMKTSYMERLYNVNDELTKVLDERLSSHNIYYQEVEQRCPNNPEVDNLLRKRNLTLYAFFDISSYLDIDITDKKYAQCLEDFAESMKEL